MDLSCSSQGAALAVGQRHGRPAVQGGPEALRAAGDGAGVPAAVGAPTGLPRAVQRRVEPRGDRHGSGDEGHQAGRQQGTGEEHEGEGHRGAPTRIRGRSRCWALRRMSSSDPR